MLDFLKFFLWDEDGLDPEGLGVLIILVTLVAFPICVIVHALGA